MLQWVKSFVRLPELICLDIQYNVLQTIIARINGPAATIGDDDGVECLGMWLLESVSTISAAADPSHHHLPNERISCLRERTAKFLKSHSVTSSLICWSQHGP